MTRHGAVLVFKEGVTSEQAAKALAKLKSVLAVPETTIDFVRSGNKARMVEKPFTFASMVESFDDTWGGPVWYIP
jgi:hypothetical protein